MSILKFSKREEMSSTGLDAMRKSGIVPAIVYCKGEESVMLSVGYIELEKQMNQGCFFNTVIDIEIDGKVEKVLPRAAQAHVVNDRILHIEMQKVTDDTQVNVGIPIYIVGTDKSEVIKRGARVHIALKSVKVRCKANTIPRAVKIDVSLLKVTNVVKIGNLKLPEGVQIMHNDHLTVIKVVGKKGVEEATNEDSA